jgi:hypothetical protein
VEGGLLEEVGEEVLNMIKVPYMHVWKYHNEYLEGRDRKIANLRPAWAKFSKTLSQKQNTNKKAGSVEQVVDCLSSMFKTLGLISNSGGKKP